MLIEQVMTTNVITCHGDKTIEDAARIMLENNIGGLPIVDDDNNLQGIISESDFIGHKKNVPHAMVTLTELFGETIHDGTIDEVFHRAKHKNISKVLAEHHIYSVTPEMSITQVSHLMLDKNVNRVPVVQDKKLVGIITRRDLLKAFIKID